MKTIYLVDNNRSHHSNIKQLFIEDYEVKSFNSAKSVIESLKRLKKLNEEMPEVIIIDYKLRGGNSLELFHTLNARLEDTKFILMIPREEENALLDVIKAGIMNYIMRDENYLKTLKSSIGNKSVYSII
ncbi:response regulator [Flexithrix dorotheae]|uniref:response regulator n=1 Tax=Flexithrix dorotheae TaxID=70993 RepID=UPI00037AB5E3|nr:response regulator [Flexithrix dorotheae]